MARRISGRSGARDPILLRERGTIHREAAAVVALGYPAPYRVAASSLGAQTVYRALNEQPGLACVRFFLPEKGAVPRPLRAAENGRPVREAEVLAFSISCETELLGIAALLDAAGLEPLAARRAEADPPVVIGGPLVAVDPRLVAPLADVAVVGEAEEALPRLAEAFAACRGRRRALIERIGADLPGVWAPVRDPIPPAPARAPVALLPALAATWSPGAELKDLFLVEAARGCGRGCAFCVMSGCAAGGRGAGFRPVPVERILAAIPADAPGVGLVGAAVTDHPEIAALVGRIVATGRRASLSSVRADRLTAELAALLVKGGLRQLAIAADGASDRLRRSVRKGISADDLLGAAAIARGAGLLRLKVYAMVGLPGEEDRDIVELADLVREMSRKGNVSLAVQAFVPKPGTPLAAAPMADFAVLKGRLDLLARRLAGRVRLSSTSPRWSWVDAKLVHAGERAALAAIAAERGGGGFAAWKRAIEEHGL